MSFFEHYIKIRHHTEEICKPLAIEDYVLQPAPFVSPPKWHLAHTTWFFEQFVLQQYLPDYSVFDNDFGFLFNSYYNNVGKRVLRMDRGNLSRPEISKIYEYRKHVDYHIGMILQREISCELESLIHLGLNHEQQHQELLITDIKYILGNNPLQPVYNTAVGWELETQKENGFIHQAGGIYEVGYAGNDFSFDNEHGRHKVYIDDLYISAALVTNKEYIAFIEAGGYTNFNYWLDEGWTWVNQNKIYAPLYWHHVDGKWHHYTLSGFAPVNPDAILTHISFYEALAFAEWKQMRLPTEFEWEIVAKKLQWGKRWEWTHSAYLPYPGFRKPDGAVGEYNGKFMINQMILRGASVATPEGHSRTTYRNFFHPEERWQFTGLRLINL